MWSVENHRDEIAQELGRDHFSRLSMEFGIGDRGCPVDRHEQAQLAFGCLHLGEVDVEEADRVGFELLLRRLVTFHIGQLGRCSVDAGSDADVARLPSHMAPGLRYRIDASFASPWGLRWALRFPILRV